MNVHSHPTSVKSRLLARVLLLQRAYLNELDETAAEVIYTEYSRVYAEWQAM